MTSIKSESMVNAPIRGMYWKLIHLNGREVTPEVYQSEIFIKLDPNGKACSGNSGCNSFGGNYTLKGTSQITIGPLFSTKMYCEGATIEHEFLHFLEKSDNYQIHDDTLFLRNAGMDSTAKFLAIYLKK